MDWALLAAVGVAAVVGGYLGARLMNRRLNAGHVKKLIAVLLLLLAGKLLTAPLLSPSPEIPQRTDSCPTTTPRPSIPGPAFRWAVGLNPGHLQGL
ncbi:TSUP family transporter [Thiohalophilus sp.]|uniref:TSUP family transporter n=1 Tax=Thiohalophilus sp. TaxID=3028392 RepID=UPI003A0FE5F7